MKQILTVLFIGLMVSFPTIGIAKSVSEPGKVSTKLGKVLVVYYSLTGNTEKVANYIKDLTGADLFEVQTEFDYTKVRSRTEMEELGKKQVTDGYQPKLKKLVSNIGAYDYIIIGSPVWWFSVSPPIMSFLSQHDLKGKKVVPFCTCVSTHGNFFEQFQDAIPNAKVLKGIVLTESQIRDENRVKERIEGWLDEVKRSK